MSYIKPALGILLLGSVLGVVLFSFSFSRAQGPAVQPQNNATLKEQPDGIPVVEVVQPGRPDQAESVNFNARLMAEKEASLFARANGFIQERLVDIGDRVEEGQLLAQLAAPELNAAVQSQKAELALAHAELKLAESNFERAKNLASSGAVSKAALDSAQADLNVKSAMVKARRANVEGTEATIQYLSVRAPFAGVITERNVEKGDKVSSSDNVPLFRILNKDIMRVVADIPQTQFFAIDRDQKAELILTDNQGQRIPVAFARAAQDVDPASGTVRVEYTYQDQGLDLLSGLNVQIAIPVNSQNMRLIVPNSVLLNRAGQTFSFVVDENGSLDERNIKTGRSFSNEIEILEGLSINERVVINPNGLFKKGDRVEIKKSNNNEP
jgi:RND family efflux transporter MFP subunit